MIWRHRFKSDFIVLKTEKKTPKKADIADTVSYITSSSVERFIQASVLI